MHLFLKNKRLLIGCLGWLFATEALFAMRYGAHLCGQDDFHCLSIRRGESWQTLWPESRDRDIVMRVNRLNIWLYPGLTLAVPTHLDKATVMDFSPFNTPIPSPGEKVVMIDPQSLAFGAYDASGTLQYWGPISAGADYCRDIKRPCRTHIGSFRVYTVGNKGCYSHKFPIPKGGAPMPYCMYFNNGQAMHGSSNGLVGYHASHGCVRLLVEDAEWLHSHFVEPPNKGNHYKGTRVTVLDYGRA